MAPVSVDSLLAVSQCSGWHQSCGRSVRETEQGGEGKGEEERTEHPT
jgi:hypothetical protein